MLEVRYNTITKEVTGWWGNRHGNHEVKLKNRPDEAIVLLNIPIPHQPIKAHLLDSDKLAIKPNYIEPLTPRDLQSEIDELKAKLKEAGIITE